jgi:hypothetical protein
MTVLKQVTGDGLMTVRDLIETLQYEDPDAIVLLASDEEGNSKHVWSGVSKNIFYETGYEIETHVSPEEDYWNDDDYPLEYDDDGEIIDHFKAVTLWP